MNLLDFTAKLATIEREVLPRSTIMERARDYRGEPQDATGNGNDVFGWPPLKPATIGQNHKWLGNWPLYETGFGFRGRRCSS